MVGLHKKAVTYHDEEGGVEQLFYLQESRVRSTLGGVQRCNALRRVQR